MISSKYKDIWYCGNVKCAFFSILLLSYTFQNAYADEQSDVYVPTHQAIESFLHPLMSLNKKGCFNTNQLGSVHDQPQNVYELEADNVSVSFGDSESTFSGNVKLQYNNNTLRTDLLTFERDNSSDQTGIKQWSSPSVSVWQGDKFAIQSKRSAYHHVDGYRYDQVLFLLLSSSERFLWGWGDSLASKKMDVVEIQQATLSACALDKNIWHIRSKSVEWHKDKGLFKLTDPEFYLFGNRIWSLNSYDYYLETPRYTWWPRADTMNSLLRLGVNYTDNFLGIQMFPYVSNKSDVGMEITFDTKGAGYRNHAVIDGVYDKKENETSSQVVYDGYRDMSRGRLHWLLHWKSRYDNVAIEDTYNRVSQSVKNYIAWSNQYDRTVEKIGWYWYRHSPSEDAWELDRNSLPKYDSLPHIHWQKVDDNGVNALFMFDDLTYTADDKASTDVTRVLSYLGTKHTKYTDDKYKSFDVSIGTWLRSRSLKQSQVGQKDTLSVVIPTVSFQWWWLHYTSFHTGLSYKYVKPVLSQAQDLIFTQNRWYWLSQSDFFVTEPDRIFDRNDLTWFGTWEAPFGMRDSVLALSHDLLLDSHKLFLSSTGIEDPQVSYRDKITRLKWYDQQGVYRIEGLWNWEKSRWHGLFGLYKMNDVTLYYYLDKGVLLSESDGYRFTDVNMVGAAFSLYQHGPHSMKLKLNYTDHTRESVYVGYSWQYDSCCLHASIDIEKLKMLTGKDIAKYRWPQVRFRVSTTG